MENIQVARNLLAISSHVVHGKVGNDAIQFPLNLRGWNVDCIHTTNFSNHPGYSSFKGSKTDPEIIKALYHGLSKIDVQYDAIIVGYISSKEVLEVVHHEIFQKLSSSTRIIMDPIMGDHGKLYVSEQLVPAYKSVLQRAGNKFCVDLLTPNQFEMETLTDMKIIDRTTLKMAIANFFEKFTVKNLVITSVSLQDTDLISCVCATSKDDISVITTPRINASFSGSGDLFIGLLTDKFVKSGENLASISRNTIAVVQKVLEVTYDLDCNNNCSGSKVYIPDLRLIESKPYLIEGAVEEKDYQSEVYRI